MTDKEIFNAEHIGIDGMLWQTQEECGELIKAIAKYNRCRGIGQKTEMKKEVALFNLMSEIADVELSIKHLKYLMNIDTTEYQQNAIDKVYERYS